jgi:membrane protein YqaA with SNARE-associated domain
MESLITQLIDWFALPKNGLSSVFLIALISATLLPLGSEPAVFGYVKLNPDQLWLAVAVATFGNTIGGAIDYWMGKVANAAINHERHMRYLKWFERLGPKALIFAWMPVFGDPLCAVAGWLKLPFWRCVMWMALGKGLRYLGMTALLMAVPDSWWVNLLRPLAG